MPSVANTTRSPGMIEVTDACNVGSRRPTTPLRMTTASMGRLAPGWARTSTPSTFPMASHVIVSSPTSNAARLMTTPRVPRSASWQRRTSEITESPGAPASVTAARCAAATPQSRWGRCPTPTTVTSTGPLSHRDDRPAAELGGELELVHEPPRPGQPQAKAPRSREPVLQCQCHVRNSRALVPGDDQHPPASVALDQLDVHLPLGGVRQNIACHFGDRGRDDREIAGGEPQRRGQAPAFLPRRHDVHVGPDRDQPFSAHAVRPAWPAG